MHSMNIMAVISDVHSNVFALEAVLQDIHRRGINNIVNLGDTLFGPIDPVGTAELLMNRSDVTNIMGNCDRYLLQNHMELATFQYVRPLLTDGILHWIESFNRIWVYEDLLFCHGTPFSDERYLLEKVVLGGVQNKSAEELMAELELIAERVVFCGHTHLPKIAMLPNGKVIVNPGSVGLPAYSEELPYPHIMESMTPHAKYLIIHREREHHSWKVELIQIPYDYELAALRADQNNREDYSYAIRAGRVLSRS